MAAMRPAMATEPAGTRVARGGEAGHLEGRGQAAQVGKAGQKASMCKP
jgi:hypothetical protein